MRYRDLITNETQRMGDFNKISQKYIDQNLENWRKNAKYVADIEKYKVKQLGNVYSLWDNNILVATASLDTSDSIPVVDQVWVNPDYRGLKIFSSLLWYFKTRLDHPKLLLGEIHSSDMQEVIKGLSRFNKSWYKNGLTEPFDLNTIDNYYSWAKSTGWQLMLENDGDFSKFPKFNTGLDYIRESYEIFID